MVNLKNKDFLSLKDFTREELEYLLNFSLQLKTMQKSGGLFRPLDNKMIAMIFNKPSTRTRVSFQVGVAQLGGQSFYMQPQQMQLGRGEPVKDTARVLDRYVDGLIIRTFDQSEVLEFARYMKAPVINALTDLTHPCQGLADLLTIKEKMGYLKGVKMLYVGDLNMCHSIMLGCAKFGVDLFVVIPREFPPDKGILRIAEEEAKKNDSVMEFSEDLTKAAKDADVIYASTWWSMGQSEEEAERRKKAFKPFRITSETMRLAKPGCIFMNPLPAERGYEQTEEVLESAQSVIFDEAENRLHVQKAILASVI